MIGINIKMPKNCKECPFTYEAYGDDYYFSAHTRNCVFDHDKIYESDTERYFDCPLVEVKP